MEQPTDGSIINLKKRKSEEIQKIKKAGADATAFFAPLRKDLSAVESEEIPIKTELSDKVYPIRSELSNRKADGARESDINPPSRFASDARLDSRQSSLESMLVGGQKPTVWEKIARLALYFLVFLLPIFFLPTTIAPLDINKQILAGALMVIGFICWLAGSFESKKIIYPHSRIFGAVLVLAAALGLSAVFSQAPSQTVWGYLVQADSLFSFAIYILAFFLAAVFLDKKNLASLAMAFFAGLALAVITGLAFLFGKSYLPILPWDFLNQPGFNPVGATLALGILTVFGLVLIIGILFNLKTSMAAKIPLLILAALIILELVAIRHSFLWLALAGAILFLAAYKFIVSPKLNPILIIISALFLFFGLVGGSFPQIVSLPLEVKPNIQGTLEVIKGSLSGKSILIGAGPATFGYDYSLHRSLNLNQTDFWTIRFNQGYSFFMTVIVTGGILTALAVLALFFSFARRFIFKDEILILGSGIIFLFAAWFFAPIFFVPTVFLFLGLGVSAGISGDKKEIYFNNLSKAKTFAIFISLTVFVAGSFALLFFAGKKYVGAVYYANGVAASNKAGDLDKAINLIGSANWYDPSNDQYLRDLSQLLILKAGDVANKGDLSGDSLRDEIQKILPSAIESARLATVANPADSLNWNNLANIYEQIIPWVGGADKFAEENYKKAMELDPKNPQAPVNLARALIAGADILGEKEENLKKEKLAEARQYLARSIDLKKDYAAGHFLLAAISMREGKKAEAIESLLQAKKTAPFDAGLALQLGMLYYQDEKLDLAKAEFERAISINANYSNAYYFLGLIYDKKGKKSEAISQFEKITALNPDNEEIKNILSNLRQGKPALEKIVPPAQPPAERLEAPVKEKEKE